MSLLRLDGIDVAYGRTKVVTDVSLEVPDRSIVCLMGRNGVGKTTLLNAAVGLLPVSAGTVTFDQAPMDRLAPHRRIRKGIGYVPQGHQVFPRLTAGENLQVVLERDRSMEPAALDEALDLFPALTTLLDRPAGLLSGGQAKQLAIARALLGRPRLLILDEPTEGIQPSIIEEIEDAIARLHATTGVSVLLVEQYVEFALRLAQHYAVMDDGRIIDRGDTADGDLERFGDLLMI
jgi:urea transport system ATP-binding protein